ncbi:FAD-dependent oxidoreductase [Trinickia caryophylli]|uniref:D-amino-acid dehydrogenase n=1 Tax=Trinickia caryophylli TaxID=28094 RepID=A0A1X7GDL2_TRICW|nr:FAD-dependent oxidoreductase [Trinickia caryophylli]PMS10791.1 FAD-binding oxidoreductase [Trinickia caryophylli]TRX13833.1 FAD-binding oxidoreductase [Trinickia caryophylli]WQE15424.1 FAD-dependent oxidoreductase [Trinickia caryophylli]SMF68095.1 D-amino-acid dehydrogenase [Trinickia caryophylli]GLU33840.1 D-amino-acid dehydrogenase [Trinickia caryophylli]
MKFDTLVLGAGMVGVSVAVHLQKRGLAVALIDRKPPGNETSFGNAGLIQREGVYPYAFPRGLGALLHYAGNKALDVRYHPAAMPKLAPFLFRYWRNSAPGRHAAIARRYATLIEHCVSEHDALAEAAGVAGSLRRNGWMRVYRTPDRFEEELKTAERWKAEFGVAYDALDPAALHALEPDLSPALVGAVHYTQAVSVDDPNALVMAYARYFEALGGRFLTGDATTLEPKWRVRTEAGAVEAKSAVVAMGPWSAPLSERLGYRLTLGIKRGYHMHYRSSANARLNHPVLDAEKGYLITPMARGVRLTTGAELGLLDEPKTPDQLTAVEPIARALFPLGERVDSEPWMGQRPCTGDMLPVIGPAPRHKDLWFAFGHAHHGLTLGPVTGRLIAEMMTGAVPFVDPAPFRVDRF